jgi:hypothetical protein
VLEAEHDGRRELAAASTAAAHPCRPGDTTLGPARDLRDGNRTC